ncbi:MAG: haloacid dehalogenase type II [Anaerovoracaceae bacterium]|nr:haloacid dehalogenase type II [Anaerovoracaceae bacterium]
MRLPKAITFDNFGTIIDWEGEIQKYFRRLMEKKGVSGIAPKTVQHRWEEIQFDYIQEYRPYHQVLRDTMKMTCNEFGIPFETEDVEEFGNSMGHWQPFPDSHDALLELKKYTKIALITNTDNAIIEESVKQVGVEFDDIVTAEMAGAYKPSHKGFLLSQQRLGLTEKEILHAGFGFKYDVVPGNELGYDTCWVNRQGESRPLDVWETFMVGDLKTLAMVIKLLAIEEGAANA